MLFRSRRVTELIDWLVDQDFRQWQAVTGKLADRRREHAARLLGAADVGSFHNDRARLIESVGREAQRRCSADSCAAARDDYHPVLKTLHPEVPLV